MSNQGAAAEFAGPGSVGLLKGTMSYSVHVQIRHVTPIDGDLLQSRLKAVVRVAGADVAPGCVQTIHGLNTANTAAIHFWFPFPLSQISRCPREAVVDAVHAIARCSTQHFEV